jgi:iron complex outermembrane recepter protein
MKNCVLRAAPRAVALAAAVAVWPHSYAQTVVLPEVVVSATRFEQSAANLSMGVSVITQDDLRASGASTLSDALVRLLGVPGRQDLSGGVEYSLDLRGFGSTAGSNQVIIVDGQRLSEADIGGTRLSGIAIDTVERIEVLRGSGAVLYGEGATGGVIVIKTKAGEGRERRLTGSGYAAAGSFGLREWRGSVTLGTDQFSADVSASLRDSDGYRDNFASHEKTHSLGLQWIGDWLRVGVRHARDELDSGLPGSLTQAEFLANPRQTKRPDNKGSIKNERASAFAQAFVGDWQFALDAGVREKKLRSESPSFVFGYVIDANDYALRAKNETSLGSTKNTFIIGTDYANWTRQNTEFTNIARSKTRAWYVKDDVTLASQTRLSVGLRTERIEKSDDFALNNPRGNQKAWELGLNQGLGANWSAYARLGRSFRLAAVDEFGFTLASGLQPQDSRDAELGARWRTARTQLELRAYNSRLTNEIGFDSQVPNPASFSGVGANVNFDPSIRRGLELQAQHKLSAALQISGSAALRVAKFRHGPNQGRDIPLVPSQVLAVRADWRVAQQHRVSAGLNWVSSQAVTFADTCKIPAYTTADVRYAYTLGPAELALGVTNLFDRRYYTQAFSCAAGAPASIYPEAGRAVTASVRMSF